MEEEFFGPKQNVFLKIWLPIIFVMIVLGGAYLVWRYLPKSALKPHQGVIINRPSSASSALNWRTYSNNIIGYTVDYPSSWTVSDEQKDADGNPIVDFYSQNLPNIHDEIAKPDLEIRTNKYPQNIPSIALGLMAEAQNPIEINGVKGTKNEENLGSDNYKYNTNTDIFLVARSHLFWLQLNYGESDNVQKNLAQKTILDTMANSFKLMTVSPLPSTSGSPVGDGWKIYKSPEYGFIIGYPAGWKATTLNEKGVNASYLDDSQTCTTVVEFSYTKENTDKFALASGMDLQISYCPDQTKYPDINQLLDKMGSGQITKTAGFEGILQQVDARLTNVFWENAVMYKKAGTGFFEFSWSAEDQNDQGWNYQNYAVKIIQSFQYNKV